MIRPFLTVVILVASTALASAKDNPAAQQQLDNARRTSDLFTNATEPFELRLDFTTELGSPMQGKFVVKWKSKDHWWGKVILGPFQQITVRNGEEEYTLRNAQFTPIAVKDLFVLLRLFSLPFEFEAKKLINKTENGVPITCIQAQRADRKSETNEFCLDPASRDVVSQEWWDSDDIRHKRQYSDFEDFEGVRYPRQLKFFDKQLPAISAGITKLEAAPFEPALLAPPPGSIERRHCIGMKHPIPLKNPQPEFKSFSTGSAGFSLTVLADGSVDGVYLIGGGELMNDPAIETLKHWKFTPAMCGTEPIVSDMQVVISSHHI
jgi:hypothetical protein